MRKENCQLPWNATKSYSVKVVRVEEAGAIVKLNTPQAAVTYWRRTIANKRWFDGDKEHLVVLLLSARYSVQGHSLVSIGSMNESIAHQREIFRAAVAGGAYAIVVMHNHPSGDPAPSGSDHSLTRRLEESGALLQIKMLDHVIVGKGRRYWSFIEYEKFLETRRRRLALKKRRNKIARKRRK